MLPLLLACADPVAEAPAPLAFCESDVHLRWDPDTSLDVFPDEAWTVPADTPTGLRVDLDPATHPFLAADAGSFASIYTELSTLDGFGTTAWIWFRADGPLPATAPEVHVTADGVDWPVLLSLTDDGQTWFLRPALPFPSGAEVVVVLTGDPADGSCVSPAPRLRALLDPAAADPPAEAASWQATVAALGIDPATVSAMTRFRTQSVTTVSTAVAADIAARDPAFVPGTCVDGPRWRQCDGLVPVQDYRDADHIVPADSVGAPLSTYDLPTRVWLPVEGDGARPVLLCGHGLGGDKGQCDVLADLAAPRGWAVVAVDAVEHGEHPGRTEADLSILDDLMILAISVAPPGLNGLRLRDNFRQSGWDKLQVVRAIEGGLDADGDGRVDLDADHLAYVGVSLGAIMGPEPMALSSRFDGGVLLVGGGLISRIIADSDTFSVLVDLMRPAGTTDGDLDRYFSVLQTVIEAGDPAVWAPHLAADRLDAGGAPSLYDGMVWQDSIVPNGTNAVLARNLEVPGVGTELWPMEGVGFEAGPVSGNLPGGGTGGVVQFAEVQEVEGGPWVPATHDNLHESVTGQAAILAFLEPLLAGEVPVIDEPARP